MRGRPVENVVKKTKYIIDYGDSKWHYNLNKFPGRKKRTTKADKQKIKNTEIAYWKEHYRLFPEDKPKKRGRRNRTNS
jgi:hypothetical protein